MFIGIALVNWLVMTSLRENQILKAFAKKSVMLLGIAVAVLLVVYSSNVLKQVQMVESSESMESISNQELTVDNKLESENSSGMHFNSGTRLLHIFTEHLPYLNNK